MCQQCGEPYKFWHGLGDLFSRQDEDKLSQKSNEILDSRSYFFDCAEPDAWSHIGHLGVDKSRQRYFDSWNNGMSQPEPQGPYDEPAPTMNQIVDALTQGAAQLFNKLAAYDNAPDW